MLARRRSRSKCSRGSCGRRRCRRWARGRCRRGFFANSKDLVRIGSGEARGAATWDIDFVSDNRCPEPCRGKGMLGSRRQLLLTGL